MEYNEYCDHLAGGRRMNGDRRKYSYAFCIPERRSGVERRSGNDRRLQSRIAAMLVAAHGTAATVPLRS